MTILYLGSNLFFKGGVARYCRYQIEALRDTADAVTVAALRGRSPGDFEAPFEVDWEPAPGGAPDRRRFAVATARLALTRRPDVIWTGHLHLGPGARRLARLTGAALVQNIYGRELWGDGLTAPRVRALRASTLVVSDCHNSAEHAVDASLVSAPPTVVWDCVDLARFTPDAGPDDAARLARYGVGPTTRFRLLFLGRLNASTRYKGAERLLELTAALPAEAVEAVIAGSGDDVEHLRARAAALGVADRVTFTGSVAEDDLPALLRSGSAFYLASTVGHGQGEGIPLTPLEALASGVPVLVGNQDGSRETLDGAGGWCGDPLDLDAQAAYVRALSTDPERHAAEREAARRRAEEAFGYEAFRTKTAAAAHAALAR